jgi:hypothetical protein
VFVSGKSPVKMQPEIFDIFFLGELHIVYMDRWGGHISSCGDCDVDGFGLVSFYSDCLCGRVVRVLGYRSGGPGSIPGTTRKKKVVGLERGPLSLMSTTEELLDRKVAAPV